MIKVKDLLKYCKKDYRLKAKSKFLPNIDYHVISFRFDEIKRNRVIFIVQSQIQSFRFNPFINICTGLLSYNQEHKLFIYNKDTVNTFPVQEIKEEKNKKEIILVF